MNRFGTMIRSRVVHRRALRRENYVTRERCFASLTKALVSSTLWHDRLYVRFRNAETTTSPVLEAIRRGVTASWGHLR